MIETLPLIEAAKGYERMMNGDARFRVVLVPSSGPIVAILAASSRAAGVARYPATHASFGRRRCAARLGLRAASELAYHHIEHRGEDQAENGDADHAIEHGGA